MLVHALLSLRNGISTQVSKREIDLGATLLRFWHQECSAKEREKGNNTKVIKMHTRWFDFLPADHCLFDARKWRLSSRAIMWLACARNYLSIKSKWMSSWRRKRNQICLRNRGGHLLIKGGYCLFSTSQSGLSFKVHRRLLQLPSGNELQIKFLR